MQYAFKVGLLAFDATRLCVADVDFPMDVILYSRGSFTLVEQRYQADDLREISNWWQERMRRSVQELPSGWIEAAFSRLTRHELAL
jgi:putative proteasome-type protease